MTTELKEVLLEHCCADVADIIIDYHKDLVIFQIYLDTEPELIMLRYRESVAEMDALLAGIL